MKQKSNSSARKQTSYGQPAWRLESSTVEAFVTETGGQLAPVTFDRAGRRIQPFSIAPWWNEKLPAGTPPLIEVLRGDFFCAPFGANNEVFQNETHPLHGEPANRKWKFERRSRSGAHTTLHLSLKTRVRAGRVDKFITLVDGHNAVYCRHAISGMKGPMNLGHHAMLKFPAVPGSGVITCSPFECGLVAPAPLENPETFGYSSLRPDTKFLRLNRVPMMNGATADLSSYPARRGFEDLVLLVTSPRKPFAWFAVTFPKEGYVWFALKDPRVLCQTVLWYSNGGRHYAPWSSRHLNVLGIEDITGYFHYGLAPSARPNPLNRRGVPTCFHLKPGEPLAVNYIMAVAKVPRGYEDTKRIEPSHDGQCVELFSSSGKAARVPLSAEFVRTGRLES